MKHASGSHAAARPPVLDSLLDSPPAELEPGPPLVLAGSPVAVEASPGSPVEVVEVVDPWLEDVAGGGSVVVPDEVSEDVEDSSVSTALESLHAVIRANAQTVLRG